MIIGKVFSELTEKRKALKLKKESRVTLPDQKKDLDYVLERQEKMMSMMATLMKEMEENAKVVASIKNANNKQAGSLEEIEADSHHDGEMFRNT
jgi:predicted component of type VI protein secretion system